MAILENKTSTNIKGGSVSEIADFDEGKVWRIIIDKISSRHRTFLWNNNFKWSKEHRNYSRIYDQRIPVLKKDAQGIIKFLNEAGASWNLILVPPPVRDFRKDRNMINFGHHYVAGNLHPAGKGWWKR